MWNRMNLKIKRWSHKKGNKLTSLEIKWISSLKVKEIILKKRNRKNKENMKPKQKYKEKSNNKVKNKNKTNNICKMEDKKI